MLIFNFAVNFIECFFLVLFLTKYFSLQNQKRYLSIMTLILLFIQCMAQFVFNNSGLGLSLCALVVTTVSLIVWTKSVCFDYVYVTFLTILGIIVISAISYSIIRFLNYCIIMSTLEFKTVSCLLSKSIQVFITMFLISRDFKIINSLDLKQWNSILCLAVFVLSGITISANEVISGTFSASSTTLLLLILLCISVLFIYIVTKIETLNNEKIKAIKRKEEAELTSKQLSMMKYLKNELESMEHRMNYILIQAKTMITDNDKEGAVNLITQFQNEIYKHKFIINTRNSIFDCLFSLKIDDLKRNGVNVSTSIFITEHRGYNDISFINSITELLDYFNSCQYLYILMNGTTHMLTLRLIYRNGEIDIDKIRAHMNICFSESNCIVNEDYETKGFKIIIDMNNYIYENDL